MVQIPTSLESATFLFDMHQKLKLLIDSSDILSLVKVPIDEVEKPYSEDDSHASAIAEQMVSCADDKELVNADRRQYIGHP